MSHLATIPEKPTPRCLDTKPTHIKTTTRKERHWFHTLKTTPTPTSKHTSAASKTQSYKYHPTMNVDGPPPPALSTLPLGPPARRTGPAGCCSQPTARNRRRWGVVGGVNSLMLLQVFKHVWGAQRRHRGYATSVPAAVL